LHTKSQYKNWKSAGYSRKSSVKIVVLNWVKEYIAIMLNSEKFVAKPALHYFITSTIEEIFVTWEVNGADMEA